MTSRTVGIAVCRVVGIAGAQANIDFLVDGLERAHEAFQAMLRGDNFGKMIVVVGADPSAGT